MTWTPALGETFEAAGQPVTVTELDPPRRIAWSWGDERYAFELEASPRGCVLRFTHVFDDRYGPAAQHAAGLGDLPRPARRAARRSPDRRDRGARAHRRAPRALRRRVRTGPDAGPADDRVAHLPRPDPGRRSAAPAGTAVPPPRRAGLAGHRRRRRAGALVPRRTSRSTVVESATPHPPRRHLVRRHAALRAHAAANPPAAGSCSPMRSPTATSRPCTGAGWHRCFARFDALLAGHPMDERRVARRVAGRARALRRGSGASTPRSAGAAIAEHPVGGLDARTPSRRARRGRRRRTRHDHAAWRHPTMPDRARPGCPPSGRGPVERRAVDTSVTSVVRRRRDVGQRRHRRAAARARRTPPGHARCSAPPCPRPWCRRGGPTGAVARTARRRWSAIQSPSHVSRSRCSSGICASTPRGPDVEQQVAVLAHHVDERPQQVGLREEVVGPRRGVVPERVVHAPHALPRPALDRRERHVLGRAHVVERRLGRDQPGVLPRLARGAASTTLRAGPKRIAPASGFHGIQRSLTTPSGTAA